MTDSAVRLAMTAPAKATERDFEDIEVGETYTVESIRTFTETDVMIFADLSGDFYPQHMSTVTGEESEFGERIVHGNLVLSIAEALIADMNPRSFSYGYDSIRFGKPVRIGTTMTIHRGKTEVCIDSLGGSHTSTRSSTRMRRRYSSVSTSLNASLRRRECRISADNKQFRAPIRT